MSEDRLLSGKIGRDSINIYQDQANAVYDYLLKAAKKIVAEEDNLKMQYDACKSAAEAFEKTAGSQKTAAIICFVAAVVLGLCIGFGAESAAAGVVVGMIPLVFGFVKISSSKKSAGQGLAKRREMAALDENYRNIRRDYSVTKLGVVYVPVATVVPFENKSFILDETGNTAQTDFSLYQMNEQEEFLNTLSEITESQKNIPLVESGAESENISTDNMSESIGEVCFHDYIGALDRRLRSASYLLNDLTKTSVSLPVVPPKGELARFLSDFCTTDTAGQPVLEVFKQGVYDEELRRFEALNDLRKRMAADNEKLEKTLQSFIADIANYVQLTSRAKITSANKLVDFSNMLLLNSFKASYNHYSAALESEEISRMQEENFDFRNTGDTFEPFHLNPGSRVLYDPISDNWVAEDGSRTSFPFGVHQIQEEIIAPLVQNLIKENRQERLKIYNSIADQKLDYLNQWHRDTDDFYGRGREEGSAVVNQIHDALAEFNAALSQYQSFEKTEKSMASGGAAPEDISVKTSVSGMAFSVAYCEEQTKQIRAVQSEFNDYIERLKEDIDRRVAEFGYTQFYDASLRDGHTRDFAMSLLAVDSFDERQKALLRASPYIAEKANLPPEPQINEEVYGVLGRDLNGVARKTLEQLNGGDTDVNAEDARNSGAEAE